MQVSWPDITLPPINLWSLPRMEQSDLYEKLIYENLEKHYQLRLTVNEFRDRHYISIRKYFQAFEGDFVPSKEGISFEASISSIALLLEGLLEIVSHQEGRELINKLYNDSTD